MCFLTKQRRDNQISLIVQRVAFGKQIIQIVLHINSTTQAIHKYALSQNYMYAPRRASSTREHGIAVHRIPIPPGHLATLAGRTRGGARRVAWRAATQPWPQAGLPPALCPNLAQPARPPPAHPPSRGGLFVLEAPRSNVT